MRVPGTVPRYRRVVPWKIDLPLSAWAICEDQKHPRRGYLLGLLHIIARFFVLGLVWRTAYMNKHVGHSVWVASVPFLTASASPCLALASW